LGKHAGGPDSGGVVRWIHVVLHWFRLEGDYSHRETPNRLEYMAEIRDALIRAKGYSQRWMAETSYSITKRSHDVAERALGWYRQFREIVLMFAISNIEPLCEPL
jgi:hypothetical protein